MTTGTIEQRVISVVTEVLRVDPAKIMPSSRIKEELGADSLDQVSLIMSLEDEFKGSITDDEAAGLVTVGDAVNFIEKKAELQTA
ncbi:MAG: acyl carrier protein [Chitinispirillaceae bacterium]|nr:acyl carrier protein [Chitinispirillaceae bacterium]